MESKVIALATMGIQEVVVSNNQILFHARSRVVEGIVTRLKLPSNEKGFKNN